MAGDLGTSARVPSSAGVNIDGPTIEVRVGRNPVTSFFVHEGLICASSAFFKGAMSHDWQESEQRSVKLEEDDPNIFRLYLDWLYRGTIPFQVHNAKQIECYPAHIYMEHVKAYVLGDKLQDGNFTDTIPFQVHNAKQIECYPAHIYMEHVKAYVLGDKLQDGNFTDTVKDAMIGMSCSFLNDQWLPSPAAITYIYSNTPESSNMRTFLVDIYEDAGNGDTLQNVDDYPKLFLFDLIKALLVIGVLRDITMLDMPQGCAYHQHGDEPGLCYKHTASME